MNPENEIFEPCNNVQTETDFKTGSFEACDSNQTKTGRGGARKNSGKKSSGIETVTVRIDKRLLNTVTEIKGKFKTTESLDDIISKPTPKNDDAKLLKKIAELEREKEELNSTIESVNSVNVLLRKALQATRDAMPPYSTGSGFDEKLRKRLIQFCHPDPIQDPRKKAIAEDLTKALNGLAK